MSLKEIKETEPKEPKISEANISSVRDGQAAASGSTPAASPSRPTLGTGMTEKREDRRKYNHGVKKAVVKSHADVVTQTTTARLNVDAIPKVADPKRRAAAEKSALVFMRSYCKGFRAGFLSKDVPPSMEKIVEQMQSAVVDGIPYHIRMPRGHGKSSYIKGVTLWALATGRRHFVEVVAANERKAKNMIRDIWICMARSTAFKEDFPEIGEFLKKCKGNWKRAPSVTYGENRDNVGMKFAMNEAYFPTVEIDGEPTPSSGAVLVGVGFAANVRGEVVGTQRPDLIIFDDLQDKKMALSPERVMEARDLINGDFLGSDSHTDTSSAFMTSTPIAPDDLSETLAKDPYWRTETYKMLKTMPSAFDPQDDACLWGKFAALWRHEMLNKRDPHEACNKFYLENRADLDAGAEVLNPDNFKPNEVSAIEHAMILYYTKGKKAFDAEYQMEPTREEFAFVISPNLILSRIRNDVGAYQVPPGFVFTAAATDINPSYALTTAIVAFDPNRSGVVIGHIIERISIHEGVNDTEFVQRVFNAITAHGRRLAGIGVKINVWGIDASGKQADAVVPFASRYKAVAMFGRSQSRINLYPKNRIHDPVNHTVECADPAKGTRWMFWDADWYKETAQRSWSSEVGAPGGLSLYGGGDHDEFAVQVANERLRRKHALPRPDLFNYEWITKEPHDYGDCVAMCYALAGANNLAAGGTALPSVRRHRKVVIR